MQPSSPRGTPAVFCEQGFVGRELRSDRAPGAEAIASTPNSSDERPRRKKTGRRRGECEKGESHEETEDASQEKRRRRVQRR